MSVIILYQQRLQDEGERMKPAPFASRGWWRTAAFVLSTVVCAGCIPPGSSSDPPEQLQFAPAGANTEKETAMSITVTSTAFAANETIPRKYTGEGADVSPPLSWSNVPDETEELVLVCDDPDAPTPKPWVHWVLYKIPAGTTSLPEGVPTEKTLSTAPKGACQGENSWGKIGYGGPMPPPKHGVHHYHFKVYALDARLDLPPGLTKEQVLKAMSGHVAGEGELVGLYERK
jgi:hypothetical protein